MLKILQIGNYPPPMCGWAVQTVLVQQELTRRGHVAQVLNVNESRKIKSPDYVDVQNGADFLWKVFKFTARGYRIHAHLNAESPKLYLLEAAAMTIARLAFRPAMLTFHGGLPQRFFPRESGWVRWAFQLIFRLAGKITCDSEVLKQAVVSYGIAEESVAAIPCFSVQLLQFQSVKLPAETQTFFATHGPVFLCYVSFRPEYRLPILRQAMEKFRSQHAHAGFIWLGFPMKELSAAREYAESWPRAERESLLLLGNVSHDEFLTLIRQCKACIRTPACDGISSSVLESLAMGVPVVASQNGRRPGGVVTYSEMDAVDLCKKLKYLLQHYEEITSQTRIPEGDCRDNAGRTVDWLLADKPPVAKERAAHA